MRHIYVTIPVMITIYTVPYGGAIRYPTCKLPAIPTTICFYLSRFRTFKKNENDQLIIRLSLNTNQYGHGEHKMIP